MSFRFLTLLIDTKNSLDKLIIYLYTGTGSLVVGAIVVDVITSGTLGKITSGIIKEGLNTFVHCQT